MQQLSYDEVAGRLGCSQNAARLRVSRALRTLTLELGAEVSASELPDDLARLGLYLEVAAGETLRRRQRRQAMVNFIGAVTLAVPFALAVAAADLLAGRRPSRRGRQPISLAVAAARPTDSWFAISLTSRCLRRRRNPASMLTTAAPQSRPPSHRLRPGSTEMAVSAVPGSDPAARRRARPHGAADPRLARAAVLQVGGRRAARARRRHPPLPPAARRPRADLGEGADPDAARDGARRARRPPRAPGGPAARRVRADAAGRHAGRAAARAGRLVGGARQARRGGARALRGARRGRAAPPGVVEPVPS